MQILLIASTNDVTSIVVNTLTRIITKILLQAPAKYVRSIVADTFKSSTNTVSSVVANAVNRKQK